MVNAVHIVIVEMLLKFLCLTEPPVFLCLVFLVRRSIRPMNARTADIHGKTGEINPIYITKKGRGNLFLFLQDHGI